MMRNRTVLITGVLGGIGSALAKGFQEEGYKVYGMDVKKDTQFICDVFFQFDLSAYCNDANYREVWTEKLKYEMPRLDVLINNAAVQLLDSLKCIRLDDWQETLNVNLTGPLLLSQLFLARLEKVNGCIINIGSIHHQLTKPRFISYATSKSALVGLTKVLAVDLAGKVRVNAISPAAIETPMLLDGFNGNIKAIEELRQLHPVQRIGYPKEVAKMAIFLASENMGFVHGANLTLDGGISSVLKDL